MAYPFFNPGYAAPYGQSFYPQNYSVINQPPVQPSPMQNQNSIIWVNSEMEVMSYPVAPNNAVTLWNAKEPVVYLKKADATGKPTIIIYDLVERTQSIPDGTSLAGGKTVDYATKDDLGQVIGAVKGIDEMIASMRSDIDSMKGDMYGIAGKKKPVKKPEGDDDT